MLRELHGWALRQWREDRGMSQGKLAALLDVGTDTVTKWETGKYKIQHGKILMLALERLEAEYPGTNIVTLNSSVVAVDFIEEREQKPNIKARPVTRR